MELMRLYFISVMALVLTEVSVFEFHFGEGRGLLYDRTAREKNKDYFWASWFAWFALAVSGWVVACWIALGVIRIGWAASVADLMEPTTTKVAGLVFATFLAGHFAWRWYRQGSPMEYWRYAGEKGKLRAEIRRLASDEETGIDEVEFEDLIAVVDINWLSDIVEHLKAQPEPRSLSLAIRETEGADDA